MYTVIPRWFSVTSDMWCAAAGQLIDSRLLHEYHALSSRLAHSVINAMLSFKLDRVIFAMVLQPSFHWVRHSKTIWQYIDNLLSNPDYHAWSSYEYKSIIAAVCTLVIIKTRLGRLCEIWISRKTLRLPTEFCISVIYQDTYTKQPHPHPTHARPAEIEWPGCRA